MEEGARVGDLSDHPSLLQITLSCWFHGCSDLQLQLQPVPNFQSEAMVLSQRKMDFFPQPIGEALSRGVKLSLVS